ncbi:MAG: aminotransferase class I/II-fold pyridoxal phosphate-dependent enzyme [Dehalococcoidales bacterium]|jgi:LL-diaminopimelate aminotransferase
MRKSYLPAGGVNLFQGIKAKTREAEASGQKIYRLSIGQPAGPALLSARKAAAEAVMSDKESMHEYQDNGSPGIPDFARRFVQAHFEFSLTGKDVEYLPTPGNKPMLGLVQLACGAAQGKFIIGTTDKPGYPTPADWSKYLRLKQYSLPLNVENKFRFKATDIKKNTRLLMVNYPHNPTGQIATREWWQEICAVCEQNDIRIFNDNPYYILSHKKESCTLTEVAADFKALSWAEAFSASKVISNGTGWRIGAIVGSPDFVADIATIKGNTDSGFVAPMAVGVLNAMENDKANVAACRETYKRRIKILSDILVKNGMRPAIEPGAGFFTLWQRPDKAFGQEIKDAGHFNYLMIEKTGVVGVHFEPYMRYSVTGDIEGMAEVIQKAFAQAKIGYK